MRMVRGNSIPNLFSPVQQMKDTFGSTNSLKGLAICAVLINHYLNINIKGHYLGFASLFVSLFFIVSGYGIYCSLDRSGIANKLRFKNLLHFYFNRLILIYPLFIVAYLIHCLILGTPIVSWTLQGRHAPGHFWFIPAIIQCYLLAPLLFIIIKRYRFLSLNIILITFIAGNLLLNSGILPAEISKELRFIHLHWRDVYFLYLLLFALSMFLPQYLDAWEEIPSYEKKYCFILLTAIVLTMMIIFKYQDNTYYLYSLFMKTICPLMILCVAVVYLLSNRLCFPLLEWIGKVSYPIYLFHIVMYKSIDKISGLGMNSLTEGLIVIVTIPLFFYMCTFIDKWNNKITDTIRLKW
jgi:peptidoglycan/LPS O-acetylase OafA/YrhL